MKTRKIFSILFVSAAMGLSLQCTDEDDAITYNVNDVSSRLSGFSTQATGAGLPLTINGSQMDQLIRVAIGNVVIPRKSFTSVTESSVTFNVPTAIDLGTAKVLLVWPGAARAFATIDVIRVPIFQYADPEAGNAGDAVTIHGVDLDIVSGVSIAGTPATIQSQSKDKLTITVPNGASTGPISFESPVGTTQSEVAFAACDSDASNFKCLTPLNVNGGFESGTLGVVGEGGAAGGNWYLAASGTRARYELIAPPGGTANLGTKTLKATILTLGDNNWDIQVVNDGYPVPPGKVFMYSGRIWADQAGRVVRLAGGVSVPSYQDMEGGVMLTLKEGWNEFAFEIRHTTPPQDDTQVRLQANISYPENEDATLYFDDFRLVATGDR